MFWDAVIGGLKVLTYWQTYVAGLEYLAIFWIPMMLFGLIGMKSEKLGGAIGCLSVLILPIFQVFGLVVFVLSLAPIIFGLSDDAAWLFPWQLASSAPGGVAKFVGMLLLAALGVGFVPVLGRVQSFSTFLLGSIALILVLSILRKTAPSAIPEHIALWPGFWFTAGLFLVGGLLAWLGTLAAAALATAVQAAAQGMAQILMLPIASVFGFIPVFIYGAWLGAQLRPPS